MNDLNLYHIEAGVVFKGNVNGKEMEVLKVENGIVKIKCLDDGKIFSYGLKALKHCDCEYIRNKKLQGGF